MSGIRPTDEFYKYMNAPQETDGKPYKQFYNGNDWLCCPFCGKRQFMVNKDTKIVKMPWKCKGSSCKKEFEVNV